MIPDFLVIMRKFIIFTSIVWLVLVLFLDFRYAKFPDVLFGGLKILLAVYVVGAFIFLVLAGISRMRSFTRSPGEIHPVKKFMG